MAKLPPKPRNIVHDYFPVGTDGQSPMNALDGSAWEAMKFKQGELDEDGKPIKSVLNKNGKASGTSGGDPAFRLMHDEVKENEKRAGDSAFPDIQGCPKGMERNAKGECVAIKKSPSWAKTVKDGKKKDKIGQNDVYDTPHDKIETPVLAMQAGKAKKKDDTPKKMPAKIGKWFSDYKKRWANHPSNQQ